MKKLLLALAIVLMFGGSALAFAWWDSLEAEQNNVTVGVGQGVTVSVNLDEKTTGNLVPAGAVMKTGDVNEVVVDFTVSLSSVDLVDPLNLDVLVENVLIGGQATNAGLVTTDVTNPGTIHNTAVEVKITVTLDEPGSQAIYDAIKNENITFDVTFTASVPE